MIEQISKYLIENIQSGKIKAGQKIFSERQLVIKFNTSLVTVQKILRIFVSQGILETKKNKGYYVKNNNWLSPIDTFGLKDGLKTTSEVKLSSWQSFSKSEKAFFKRLFFKMDEWIIFEKNVYLNNKQIKKAFVGVDKKKYLQNSMHIKANQIMSNNYFSIRKYLLAIKELVGKRIDVFEQLERKNLPFNNYVSFESVTFNLHHRPIEIAITYVEKIFFNFEIEKKIINAI